MILRNNDTYDQFVKDYTFLNDVVAAIGTQTGTMGFINKFNASPVKEPHEL